MASPPPLGIPSPAPERPGRDIGSAAMVTTHASAHVAAAVSPSQDIIFEILSWLPAKSLGRCRCVSKEWRALISSRVFLAAHRSRAEPLLIAMCALVSGERLQLMDTEGTVVRVVEPRRTVALTLRASLGHLACISYGYDHSGTAVGNLATGETLLACSKPAEKMHYLCFGLGRAALSGSLKVFRLGVHLWRLHTESWEVLSLGDGAKWRHTKSAPKMLSLCTSNTSGVAVNGALHFLSEDKVDVLSFDLDNENWKVMHGPHGLLKQEAITLAELNGSLCMVQRVQRVINMWLLSDSNKNIWIRAYKMPVPEFGFEMPLRLLRLGGKLLFTHYDNTGKTVFTGIRSSFGEMHRGEDVDQACRQNRPLRCKLGS